MWRDEPFIGYMKTRKISLSIILASFAMNIKFHGALERYDLQQIAMDFFFLVSAEGKILKYIRQNGSYVVLWNHKASTG